MFKTKYNRILRILTTPMIATILILTSLSYPVQAKTSTTYAVNSTADLPDSDVADHICMSANGGCTLRAAIMQADFFNEAATITLPAGNYTLTRPGLDDNAVIGDLDIVHDLSIQGAGSASTIVDGNGTVTGDRVFQILSSAVNTSLSGLTIRGGLLTGPFDVGGGLSWEAGGANKLTLNDVVFESNSSRYGGGLSLNYGTGGSAELDNVVLRSNTSGAAGAGLLVEFSKNLSSFIMKGGKVYNNTGANQGGGIELEGTQDGTSPESIQNVEIFGNKANFGAGIDNYGGASPYKLDLSDSSVHDNQALVQGGGINNFKLITITRTTLNANQGGTYGGGLFNQNSNSISEVQAFIDQSTISNNTAQNGGGVYNDSMQTGGALVTLTNSTLSGNIAAHDGGGVYVNKGEVSLNNATIASNQIKVPAGDPYQGTGAGLFSSLNQNLIPLYNTILAGNTHQYGNNPAVADDCSGPVSSYANNLIQTTTNCQISGAVTANIYGKDPLLGKLGNNGGPTLTQQPAAASPAIDAGETPNCVSAGGQPLLIDQRGFKRPVGTRCDIGAVEFDPAQGPFGGTPTLFLPFIGQ